jgi:ABC-2 type transport system permease protein
VALALMVSYVFGESISREAHWSYLPVLLTTPVGRGQLLRQKAMASALVCLFGLMIFAAVRAAVGPSCYGTGPLVPASEPHLSLGQMGWRIPAILCYMAIYPLWVGAVAMFLSVLAGGNGVAAFGGAAAITLTSHLFGGLPTLGVLRSFLPTRNFDAWLAFTNAHVDWIELQWGTFLSLLYASLFGLLAYAVFSTKDIRGSGN